MILIVASTKDVASMNIRQQLLSHYCFDEATERFHENKVYDKTLGGHEVRLVTINEEPIYYQAITNYFRPELIVYLSRHSSKSGTPTLSVHTPGNLGQAEKGGMPRKVSIAPAIAMKEALLEMASQKEKLGLDYEVSYECTHHGPSLDVAAMFVELGSSMTQWKDMNAAEAVAHAAVASITRRAETSKVAVGIGGPHYSRKFTRMASEDAYAFGHMVPKYAVSQVSTEILVKCLERTVEKVETIVLDWKGIKSEDKAALVRTLREIGIETEKA